MKNTTWVTSQQLYVIQVDEGQATNKAEERGWNHITRENIAGYKCFFFIVDVVKVVLVFKVSVLKLGNL